MFGELPNQKYLAKKCGEWIDFRHKDTIYKLIWQVKVWQSMDDLPNPPNFPSAKHSRCTVCVEIVLYGFDDCMIGS